ncbi:unnamed protein product [Cuscuta campestris]|uniref:Uncharacterized protein n=1 Tax=Cuscuta campestris TaxID=132261 RepID=A0A484MG21_9ASTE|nr:unnamed protein product [Cuscuta campestris]
MVCVELDLSKELPHSVWLHVGHLSFLQPIHYEDVPQPCSSCKRCGHKTYKKTPTTSRWIKRDAPKPTRPLICNEAKLGKELIPNPTKTEYFHLTWVTKDVLTIGTLF